MKSMIRLIVASAAIMTAGYAQAQADSHSRFIVPYSPGGPTDVVARLLSEKLATGGEKQFLVINKPGASGNIGAHEVVRSAADGQTLALVTDTMLTVNPFVFKRMPFDPARDLKPVATVAGMTQVLVVNPSVEARTLKEFVALAKTKPMHFANGGGGGPSRLTFEALLETADFKMESVAYKGNAPAVGAILSGEVQAGFSGISNVLAHVKAGKLRALAVSTPQRSEFLPDVPTVAEAGYDGFDVQFSLLVMAPAQTPDGVVRKLGERFEAAIKSPELKAHYARIGLDPVYADAQQTHQRAMRDRAKWKPLVERLNISSD